MICDGDVNYVQSTIDRAIETGIVIYTINVVNGNNALLEKISQQTGGQYYYAATSDEITDKINEIRSGTLDLVNTTDANNPDTDDDGISVFDEIGGLPKIGVFDFIIGKFTHLLSNLKSNPKLKDSDGDSVVDYDDLYPYVTAPHCAEYGRVESYNYDFYKAFINEEMQTRIEKTKELSELAMDMYFLTDYGKAVKKEEYTKVKEFAQDVLKDGQSIVIASKIPFKTYTTDELEISTYFVNNINWMATLGNSSEAMVASVTRDGNE